MHARDGGVLLRQVTTVEGVDVDVSINSAGGVHTAALVSRHMAAHPALRPLALTLKALLRAAAPAALNDVAVGGLGSYSLVNMLVAHLMLVAQVAYPWLVWVALAWMLAVRVGLSRIFASFCFDCDRESHQRCRLSDS